MFQNRRLLRVLSTVALLTILFSSLSISPAVAQGNDGLKREVNAQTGKVSFLGPQSGRSLPASKALGIAASVRPSDPALELAKRFAPEFGLKSPERDLSQMKANRAADGRISTRFQQKYQGVPVMGGELIVNTNDNGDLYSMNGEVSADLSLSTQPAISSEQAKETALKSVAKWYQKTTADFIVSEPELWVYDENLLHSSSRPAELVWRMEVTPVDVSLGIRELVLINAQHGSLSLHFNQVDTAWKRPQAAKTVPSLNGASKTTSPASTNFQFLLGAPKIKTYTANNGTTLPGTFLCDQTKSNCTNGVNPHADAAHLYAIGTYNLYATQFNRDSINGLGMTIISSVHYSSGYDNAFWSGTQMVYGDASGWPLADDVVAHELTHGVTQYESNLFYYYQSGAINESFSDLWGEYYDQTNGLGTDTAGWKWFIGEDVAGSSALRDMSNPPTFGDPDKISSPNYYQGEDDNGGVHYNSGVNNKAVYLMVDGNTFNGKTVTGLGWTKVAAIYYEANTNLLSSGADYSDLYYALQQACTNLIGQKGITSADCAEVKNAVDAVEMNGQPVPGFNTEAPYCDLGNPVTTVFADSLEAGTGNWTFSNGAYPRWQVDSPDGPYAQYGLHSLFANDSPDVVTDATAKMKAIFIPANTYLRFAQAYGFENASGIDYDGGVLEFSTNNGGNWSDAGPLMDSNGYNGTIFVGANNPLSGRPAFAASSHGYISTRLNLTSLAGQTVVFRWRMGLDEAGFNWGWWVDNIQAYTCPVVLNISGNAGVGGATLSYNDGTPKTVTADGSGNYSIKVLYGWSGTVTPSKANYLFNPTNRTYNNLTTSQTSQNFTAIPLNLISGNVGVAGVALNYTDGTAKTAYSLIDGSYSLAVTSNWSGAVTPTHPCYTFNPTSRNYISVVSNQTGQNYAATFNNLPECAVTAGVFRPTNGALYLKNSNTAGYADLAINYGMGGDYPVVGDWNGDGMDTIGVFRNGAFYLRNSNTIGFADISFSFGIPGDIPVAGDWNGDGIDTIGIYRNGVFYLRNSNTAGAPDMTFQLGMPGDVAIAGDWNGDNVDTTGVFRPSNGYIFLKNSNTTGYADIGLNYGIPGDRPVTGDWNNDGIDTIGVYRGGKFYLRNSNTIGYADIVFALGMPGDMPIAGNWDGKP